MHPAKVSGDRDASPAAFWVDPLKRVITLDGGVLIQHQDSAAIDLDEESALAVARRPHLVVELGGGGEAPSDDFRPDEVVVGPAACGQADERKAGHACHDNARRGAHIMYFLSDREVQSR